MPPSAGGPAVPAVAPPSAPVQMDLPTLWSTIAALGAQVQMAMVCPTCDTPYTATLLPSSLPSLFPTCDTALHCHPPPNLPTLAVPYLPSPNYLKPLKTT